MFIFVYAFFFTSISLLYWRLYLAAMHYNENGDREQAVTTSGQAMYKIKSKKGEATAKPAPSYGMLSNMFCCHTFTNTIYV